MVANLRIPTVSDHIPLAYWSFPSDPARTGSRACAIPSDLMLAEVAAAALVAFTPVVIHDSHERSPLTSADAHAPVARTNDPRPAAPRPPRATRRSAGRFETITSREGCGRKLAYTDS